MGQIRQVGQRAQKGQERQMRHMRQAGYRRYNRMAGITGGQVAQCKTVRTREKRLVRKDKTMGFRGDEVTVERRMIRESITGE